MRLSVLDYGLIDEGNNAQDALKECLILAREAEQLGFSRFWAAEHHGIKAFAISNPELMMMHLAENTERINIGSGGIMALHYSAYNIAEKAATLSAIHPGRIDIGIGSALSTRAVQNAMESHHQKEEYATVVTDIQRYLSASSLQPSAQSQLQVQPSCADTPHMFVLSHSEDTAKLAGTLGIGYTFGVFPFMRTTMIEQAQAVSAQYKKHFIPTDTLSHPYIICACFVVIADTDEEAESLAKCLDIWMLGNQEFNEFSTYPSIDQAHNYSLTTAQEETIASNRSRMIVGSAESARAQLNALIDASCADELMVIPLMPNINHRCSALRILAQLYL